MELLTWIEGTALAEWVRIDLYGYPAMITLHSVGLATMVGLAIAIDLRLLGKFRGIPLSSLRVLFRVAWVGFLINFMSGVALFTSQATSYVTNVPFLVKMAFVLTGAATVGYLQTATAHGGIQDNPGEAVVAGSVRVMAVVSIVVWLGATITGRLIAYL